jgi:hypothetical protein
VLTSHSGLVRSLRRVEAGLAVSALCLWSALPFPPDGESRVPSVFLGAVALAGFYAAYAWRRPSRGAWWTATLLAAGVLLRLVGGVMIAVTRPFAFTWPMQSSQKFALAILLLFYGSQVVAGVLLYRMRDLRDVRSNRSTS